MFPEPALVLTAAIDCAHNSMLIRYTDNHLAQSLASLFMELMSSGGKKSGITDNLDKPKAELKKLEYLLTTLPNFRQRSIQTGDICLARVIYYAIELAGWLGKQQIIDNLPTVFGWWQWINEHRAVSDTILEIDRTHKTVIKRLQGEG